jgi:hypothetical protein
MSFAFDWKKRPDELFSLWSSAPVKQASNTSWPHEATLQFETHLCTRSISNRRIDPNTRAASAIFGVELSIKSLGR